jgi:hypothetical protein
MEICNKCKKESLILIDCRCGKKFCMRHKDDNKHKCTFNYHQKEKEKLNKKKIKFNTKLNLI